jgi:hypothetical protein
MQVRIDLLFGNGWNKPARFGFVVTWFVTVIQAVAHTAHDQPLTQRPRGSYFSS